MFKTTNPDEITLDNLGKGVAHELFAFHLKKTLADILDPNTEPKEAREINLKFVLKPEENRSLVTIIVQPTSKLAKTKPWVTQALVGSDASGVAAKELQAAQTNLFDPSKPGNVVSMDNGGAKT